MWQIWRRFNKGWRNSLLIGRHFFVYQATLGSTPPSTWRRNQFCFIFFSGPKWNHGPWGHSRGNVSQGKKFFCKIIKIACETSVLDCLQNAWLFLPGNVSSGFEPKRDSPHYGPEKELGWTKFLIDDFYSKKLSREFAWRICKNLNIWLVASQAISIRRFLT